MLTEAVAVIRSQGGALLREVIVGDEGLEASELATIDDPGLHGPSSIVWRVHGDSAMLIGGLRALMLQTLHPLAMAGVADHSDYRHDPWGRLNRTGRFVGATTFGSTAAAEAAIETVRRVHRRVVGTAPDGRAYSANDPHLMLWVHITEVDSFLRAYQQFGEGTLTAAERDQYVAEMADVARRLGTDTPPTTVADLRQCMRSFRPECRAGGQARDAIRFLMFPPMPLWTRGTYALVAAGAVSLLPRWARRELWIPAIPLVDPIAVRPAVRLFTRGVGWLMASGSTRAELDGRLATAT